MREAQQKRQELESGREALRHKALETRAAEQVRPPAAPAAQSAQDARCPRCPLEFLRIQTPIISLPACILQEHG